jgi:hypothetical protein
MSITKKVAAPNALLLLNDIKGGVPPAPGSLREAAVASTPSCIAIGCMSDCDGETEVRVGPAREVGTSDVLVFEGELECPSRKVVITTTFESTVLEMQVRHPRTRVRIWTNRPNNPDKIAIGLD